MMASLRESISESLRSSRQFSCRVSLGSSSLLLPNTPAGARIFMPTWWLPVFGSPLLSRLGPMALARCRRVAAHPSSSKMLTRWISVSSTTTTSQQNMTMQSGPYPWTASSRMFASETSTGWTPRRKEVGAPSVSSTPQSGRHSRTQSK